MALDALDPSLLEQVTAGCTPRLCAGIAACWRSALATSIVIPGSYLWIVGGSRQAALAQVEAKISARITSSNRRRRGR